MKIGDKIDIGNYTATVMSMDKPPGFARKTRVVLRVEFDLEDFENGINKKSKRRTSAKKASSVKRKN